MIEIDIFKVKSGELVVFHDETLDRLANAGGKIEDYHYFTLKSKVILDGNHKIPLVQDVIRLIDKKVRLNIEIKGKNTIDRLNHIVNHFIEDQGWPADGFIISSFRLGRTSSH